jgi:hypothetical protein
MVKDFGVSISSRCAASNSSGVSILRPFRPGSIALSASSKFTTVAVGGIFA